MGKHVFINMGCKFQDQGGIDIGDGVDVYKRQVLNYFGQRFLVFKKKDAAADTETEEPTDQKYVYRPAGASAGRFFLSGAFSGIDLEPAPSLSLIHI